MTRVRFLLFSILAMCVAIASPSPALAANAAGILAPLASWMDMQTGGVLYALVGGCILGCVGTLFTLIIEGLKASILLVTFFLLALGTGFTLAAPLMVRAVAGLFGVGAVV